MSLTDVLPQVERLDSDDLNELQMIVGDLLRSRAYVPSQSEANIVNERYCAYLAHPEESVGLGEMMAYIDDLIRS
ncbi:MAG: hypothetical protein LBI33_03905 [Propionibacteriaceae bacterium]|jgi:hypothetical protein|nr:hypothetical protein [Propionibacteriaceae bacterium]